MRTSMRAAQVRYDNMLPLDDDKEDCIQERFDEIQLDEDVFKLLLSKAFVDNVDCYAVQKAIEKNYQKWNDLIDALSEFTFEIARADLNMRD